MTYIDKNLPAIIIEPMDSALQKQNQYYEETYRIKISFIAATKQFYWAWNTWLVSVKKYIQNMIEKKKDWYPTYDEDSILWVLKKVKCIVVDNETIANDVYIESVQYINTHGEWWVGYRVDIIIRAFNKQIQWF